MYRSNDNRIFPMILIAVVVIALVAGLVTVGRYLLSSNSGDEETQSQQQKASDELTTVDGNRSVRMTIRGPLVAEEEFRTYRISVSPESRVYVKYSGYLDKELDRKSYDNNTRAYEQLVHALDKAAMTSDGKYTEEEAGDLRGICATGRVYEFEILTGSNVLHRYWTSTCKGSPGTFGANVQQVGGLFRTQIPDERLDLGNTGTASLQLR